METKERKLRELTEEELAIFSILVVTSNGDLFFNKLTEEPGGWVLKAIEKRFIAHKLEVEKKVMIMILIIGNCVVGKCAKYVDDIANICYVSDYKKINWDMFSKNIYPFGIPEL